MIGNTLGIIKNNYDVWIKQKKYILCKSQQSKILKNPASTFAGLLPLLWYLLSHQEVLDLKETRAFSCLRHSGLMEQPVFRKRSYSPYFCTVLTCRYSLDGISIRKKIYKAYVEESHSSQSCNETAPIKQHWKSTIKREDGENLDIF